MLPTLPGEGIPRVLLEAMAAGLPVVTTRVAGIPSLITHERNGLLVDEPGGRRRGGRASVALLDRRAAAAAARSQNGYETARAHTLEAQAARMMDDVLAAARRHAAAAGGGAGVTRR